MIVVPLKEGENIEKALKKFKRNYACCLRSAITAGRRIKIQNLSARLVLLDSYSYFRCIKVDAT